MKHTRPEKNRDTPLNSPPAGGNGAGKVALKLH